MIQIDDKLLSEDLFSEHFVCDLSACKGACCVEGDAGAPLLEDEIDKLEDNLSEIMPFLNEQGKAAITKAGAFVVDVDGEYVTPLVKGKECAYATFDENGIAKCGIEQAHRAGKSDFLKPVSCHLYPIRVHQGKYHEALNYHRWPICAPACECGSKLKVKVFRFLKEAIIRAYGAEFYEKLEQAERLKSEI